MAEEKKAKKKRPTAEKRMLQNEKRRQINQAFKSKMRTAIRQYQDALKEENAESKATLLNLVYKLVDKGVKRGILKQNTGARMKSRLTVKGHAKT